MSFDTPRLLSRRNIDTSSEAGRLDRRERSQLFLQQHQRECSNFERLPLPQKRRFLRSLRSRIADERNLQEAVIHLTSHGEKAPGPNGQCLTTLWREARVRVFQELKALARQLESGTYQPNQPRTVNIPKSSGTGHRTISISNWQDQVVQRAVVQIIQPLLDPRFDDLSLGYRPGRDRTEALARAIAIAEREERYVWVISDLKDAFDHVNHQYLLRALKGDHWLDKLIPLIRRIIAIAGTTGIPQGGALSPLLLNVVLNKAIDRQWRRLYPHIPLIRVADDICLLCRTREESQAAWNDLRRIATDIGMQIKGTQDADCFDLSNGQHADWLGVEVRKDGSGIKPGLSRRFSARLRKDLEEHYTQPDSLLVIAALLRGKFDQLGPIAEDGLSAAHEAVRKGIEELQIETPVSTQELRTVWEHARVRYLARQSYYHIKQSQPVMTTNNTARRDGFAYRYRTRPETRVDAETSTVTPVTVELTTAMLPNRVGAWLCAVESEQNQNPEIQCESVRNVTASRLALLGVRAAIKKYPDRSLILRTDSDYLANVFTANPPSFIEQQPSSHEESPHANQDLLRPIIRSLQQSGRRLITELRPPQSATRQTMSMA